MSQSLVFLTLQKPRDYIHKRWCLQLSSGRIVYDFTTEEEAVLQISKSPVYLTLIKPQNDRTRRRKKLKGTQKS